MWDKHAANINKKMITMAHAYIFVRARKKDIGIVNGKTAPEVSPAPIMNASPPVPEEPPLAPPVIEPVKMREPIPLDQQRELFKWILEERSKVKPKDLEEEKRIDQEKAILEQFIHDESIPSLLTETSYDLY